MSFDYSAIPAFRRTSAVSFIPPPNRFVQPAPEESDDRVFPRPADPAASTITRTIHTGAYIRSTNDASAYTRLHESMRRVSRLPYYHQARQKADPHGRMARDSVFMHGRGALKLANLAAACPAFPSPRHACFLDLCGGPGGFVEYLFFRGARAGVGVTLARGPIDYAPPHHPEFTRVYGAGTDRQGDVGRVHGDGDVTRAGVQEDVVAACMRVSQGAGMSMALADGGVPVDGGDEEFQEEAFAQLVLCQVLLALSVLAPGGALVLKLVSTRTYFMRDLLRLVSPHFSWLEIVKPRMSRPGNSERYLVAGGFREDAPQAGSADQSGPAGSSDKSKLVEFLKTANEEMNRCKATLDTLQASSAHSNKEAGAQTTVPIRERVDLGLLGVQRLLVPENGEEHSDPFGDWLREVDLKLLERQIAALERIEQWHENPSAPGFDVATITRRVYREWDVEDPGEKERQESRRHQERLSHNDRRHERSHDQRHERSNDQRHVRSSHGNRPNGARVERRDRRDHDRKPYSR